MNKNALMFTQGALLNFSLIHNINLLKNIFLDEVFDLVSR